MTIRPGASTEECDQTGDLSAFQTSSWYSNFESVCFPTRIVPLPRSAVEYLESDGISAHDLPSAVPPAVEGSGSIVGGDSTTDDDEFSSQVVMLEPLKAQMASAIEQLGGQVMPKLNWSAPVDATWISPDGLRCSNPDEVLLLLKSSERAAHDLHCIHSSPCRGEQTEQTTPTATTDGIQQQHHSAAASGAPLQPEIVLKQFKILDHSMEFRAFVLDHNLFGISQRDPTQHFPAIQDLLPGISCAVEDFHHKHMAAKFDRPHYAFDVYVTKRLRVKLLDINPAYGTTQALLFSWDELSELARGSRAETNRYCDGDSDRDSSPHSPGCELRAVKDPMHIQTSAKSLFGAPIDTLDMPGMSWPGVFDVLKKQCCLQECDADEA